MDEPRRGTRASGDEPPSDRARNGAGAAAGEAELARRIAAREDGAVREFLERFRPLLSHCVAQFASEADAREDLLQEVVSHLFERFAAQRFDPAKGSLGTFVYRIAWCRCVDQKRRESAGRRLPKARPGELLEEPVDGAAAPSASAGSGEVAALVRACLAELDPEDAELLRLRHIGDLSLVEIAERRGQTLETVKYRVKRAGEALRRRLVAHRVSPEALE